jgi:hypothetical protein
MVSHSLLVDKVSQYVDIPFNISLSIILVVLYGCILYSRKLLLLLVVAASMIILRFDNHSSTGEFIKIMCELPLGLGSVLAFLCASRAFQNRYLHAFTTYVNFAVYGNIVMMVATPSGGTMRGLCGKLTCIALSVWIVQQGYQVGWRTIKLHDHLFVFTAVNKSWVFAHSLYRFVLLTLPTFGSGRRHRLLELYSLAMTFVLSKSTGLPYGSCFGMADTLVVPAAAGWSAIATTFDLMPHDAKGASNGIGDRADYVLSGITFVVAVFCGTQIARAWHWT